MSQALRELYRSSNGDRWVLVLNDANGRPQVLHEPNRSSGGRASRTEIGDFLIRDAHGPQHAELLRLIGTLVDESAEGVSSDANP